MRKNLLKTMLATLLLAVGSTAWADNFTFTPSQTTKIWGNGTSKNGAQYENTNGNNCYYDASATFWLCTQANISDGKLNNQNKDWGGSYVVLTKFDASELVGMTITKATLTFNSVCTVSGKNSNVITSAVSTDWDATTATWNNTVPTMTVSQISKENGQNVRTNTLTLTEDVTDVLAADEDGIVGFAIYTYTAREQKISNITLEVEAVDEANSAEYTINWVDADNNVVKTETLVGNIGTDIALTEEQKSAFTVDGQKFFYVSDDAEGKTIVKGTATVVTVTVRKAETFNYTVNFVTGSFTSPTSGTAVEGDKVTIPYSRYLVHDGQLYKRNPQGGDKKLEYNYTFTPTEDNTTVDITYDAVSDIDNVIYISEAEYINGFTLCTSNNAAIRSSNCAAAYCKENVSVVKLAAGTYKLHVCLYDAQKTPNSSWTFMAGENELFTINNSSVNFSEQDAPEFTLTETTDFIVKAGGGNSIGLDALYFTTEDGKVVYDPLYLETDLTAQFTALTNPVNWVNAIGASTMAYAGWAAPQVTVNGNKVALVESYGEGQEFKLKTGDVMYQTITGLTPGTYAIELYGSANLTAGRAGMTTDFAEGDEQSKKAAYLYAEAGGTVTKTYIPAIIESDMNNRGGEEAIPTAKLEGIVVGDDGTVKVGLAKELGLTNWHFVQLKSVIAQVDAELLYAALVEKPMNAQVKAAMTAAITAARLDQSEENMAALSTAITDAQASAAAYEPLVENLEAIDDVIDNCVEYGATDTSAYDEIAEAAANGTYEDSEIEGVLSSLRDIVIAIVKQQTKEGADFTPVIENTWVGQSGNYLFQGEYYAERWNGSLYTGDVLTQTVDGLPNGKYEITLRAAANVAWVTGNTGDDLTELFANNSKQNITVGSLTELGDNDFNTYTIEGIVTDGTLTYGLRNIAEGGNWFVIDAQRITYVSSLTVSSDVAEALEELNAAIEHAITVLADNVASPEAEDALLDVIDEADALYKKGKKGDQEATPEAIAEMIQRLQDAEAAYLKDAETYDPTTAISSLNADGSRRSVYTIGGQKVDGKLQKGVYVVNGRKVVIK